MVLPLDMSFVLVILLSFFSFGDVIIKRQMVVASPAVIMPVSYQRNIASIGELTSLITVRPKWSRERRLQVQTTLPRTEVMSKYWFEHVLFEELKEEAKVGAPSS